MRPLPSTSERGTTAILLSAAAVAVAGLVLLAVMLTQPRVRTGVAGEAVRAGRLTFSVSEAAWVGHDMASMGQMPMPGMPAEDASRLHVKVLVGNASDGRVPLRAEDFRLLSASGRSWSAQRATVPASTDLSAGQSLVGDLYFEVPDGQSGFRLSLSQGRARGLLTLPLPGSMNHAERNMK